MIACKTKYFTEIFAFGDDVSTGKCALTCPQTVVLVCKEKIHLYQVEVKWCFV
jgi:hypothetical protein